MATIIGIKDCLKCVHSFRDDDVNGYVCRYNPPVGHPIVVMTNQGASVVGRTSVFPPVTEAMSCSKWQSGVRPLSDLPQTLT